MDINNIKIVECDRFAAIISNNTFKNEEFLKNWAIAKQLKKPFRIIVKNDVGIIPAQMTSGIDDIRILNENDFIKMSPEEFHDFLI